MADNETIAKRRQYIAEVMRRADELGLNTGMAGVVLEFGAILVRRMAELDVDDATDLEEAEADALLKSACDELRTAGPETEERHRLVTNLQAVLDIKNMNALANSYGGKTVN